VTLVAGTRGQITPITIKTAKLNVKNFHGSLTTIVKGKGSK